jgi:hypothetical protein
VDLARGIESVQVTVQYDPGTSAGRHFLRFVVVGEAPMPSRLQDA